MAKTTRKTATSSTESTPRAARPKAAAKASTADSTVPKTAKAPRARVAGPARAPRKVSTVAVTLATADDRPAMVPAPAPSAPTHGDIAERAYHIYLRRNGRPGNPVHDWLQAVEELRAERAAG